MSGQGTYVIHHSEENVMVENTIAQIANALQNMDSKIESILQKTGSLGPNLRIVLNNTESTSSDVQHILENIVTGNLRPTQGQYSNLRALFV